MRPLLLFVAIAASLLPASLIAATPATQADVSRYVGKLLADNYSADGPGAAVLIARGDTYGHTWTSPR